MEEGLRESLTMSVLNHSKFFLFKNLGWGETVFIEIVYQQK